MRSGRLLLFGLLGLAACGSPKAPDVLSSPSESPSVPAPSPSSSRPDRSLFFATKSGYRVTLRKVDVATKETSTLLTYNERARAEHSGNYWAESAPSTAITADGKTIAFAAEDGLHTFDVETRQREALVSRTAKGKDEDSPASWSPSLGDDAFGLHTPRYSRDGRFLSFEVSHYEGSSIWFYDLVGGRLVRQVGLPKYSYADPSLGPLSWAPAGATTVVPQNGTNKGLVLSARDDPTEATSFLRVGAVGSISEAAVSPDGNLVAYLFGDDEYGQNANRLALASRRESDTRTIDEAGIKSSIAFDGSGRAWWIGDETLFQWDGSQARDVGRLDVRLEWEILSIEADQVSLAGRSDEAGRARFVVLDAVSGETLVHHDSETEFTTYLGLA